LDGPAIAGYSILNTQL